MSTSQIVWIVVIAVVALALIGLIAASMRKKSQADNRAQAAQLRERADTQAADLPDAQARAAQAEAQADRARLAAERAEEHSATVRADADQQQAIHEEQIRAADRLDPDVNHKAADYSPHVVDPAGPSNVPTDPTYADPDTGLASDSATRPIGSTPGPSAPSSGASSGAGGSSVTLEPADTTSHDETLEGDAPTDSDTRPDETTGGAHRA